MRIPFIIIAFCLAGIAVTAKERSQVVEILAKPETETYKEEDQTNRTGAADTYFPGSGDFGIGFDGTPFLNYIGNMFNGTTNNALDLRDNTLHFRYFVTDHSAVRLSLRINALRETDKYYLDDQAARLTDPLSRNQVEDKRVVFTNEYETKAGYLFFRGENRLRGYFGGDIFFGYGKERREFAYGNQMTELNPSPETVINWETGNTADRVRRPLEETTGSTINIGLGAVVGSEYYFMPGVCIGAEMGLIYGKSFYSQAYEKTETMSGSLHVEEDVEITPGRTERAAFTTFPYTFGNLFLMVQF